MAGRALTIEQILAQLAETPIRIAVLTTDVAQAQLHAAPEPGEWSVNGVLAHLRSCADVWGDCIGTMLGEDKPTLRAVNPTTWINRTDYPDLRFGPSLRAYTTQRAALLRLLDPLPHDGWARTATVTGAGAPIERTVHFYAQWLARHEGTHLKQVARTVATVTGYEQPQAPSPAQP